SGVACSIARRFLDANEQLLGVFHELALRELQTRIHHRPGQAEKRLRISWPETSHGGEPLQPHSLRPTQVEQSSGKCLGPWSDRSRFRLAPTSGSRTQSCRQEHPGSKVRVALSALFSRINEPGPFPKLAEFDCNFRYRAFARSINHLIRGLNFVNSLVKMAIHRRLHQI